MLLDYKASESVHCQAQGIEWFSISAHPFRRPTNLAAYAEQAALYIKTQKPDWIIGFSDTWYGILATYLGERYCVKTLIDAYDNYESYIPWLKPLHWLWRFSLYRATAISAAGPQLIDLMSRSRRANSASAIIPMAADPLFQPINTIEFRKEFALPEEVPLVGYCGSLYKNRGVDVLFQAMEQLLTLTPNAKLVISGRKEKGIYIPESIKNAVIELGYLPDEIMPRLINTIDVLLVINKHSAFGDYSYPAKLYEAMQCQKPVICSNTISARWVLKSNPECLADSNDPKVLAKHIALALSWKTKVYNSNPNWILSAKALNAMLETL
jgi:glycosyltransferase involved in cell wall biosynthesis